MPKIIALIASLLGLGFFLYQRANRTKPTLATEPTLPTKPGSATDPGYSAPTVPTEPKPVVVPDAPNA